jgi:hypothetical protein
MTPSTKGWMTKASIPFDDYGPDRFDQRRINRTLHKLAAGSYPEALEEIHDPGLDRIPRLPLSVPIQTVECAPVSESRTWVCELRKPKRCRQACKSQLIRQELMEYLQAHRPCRDCQRMRDVKVYRRLRFRSAFGNIALRSPRLCRCECAKLSGPATFSALNSNLTTYGPGAGNAAGKIVGPFVVRRGR